MNRSDFTAFSTDSRSRRQPARDRAGSARSARARGLRTLQHQSLPASTRFAIDTEVWLRSLVLERWGDDEPAPDSRWATKDQVHDEALAWFLERQGGRKLEPSARARGPGEDLTFWLDSRLLTRARQLAHRSGMRLAHLIEMALNAYVIAHVPVRVLAFRRRVQLEAQRLHRQRTTAAPGVRARVNHREPGKPAPGKLQTTARTRSQR
jgi:hypothetical protein